MTMPFGNYVIVKECDRWMLVNAFDADDFLVDNLLLMQNLSNWEAKAVATIPERQLNKNNFFK